MEKIYILKSEFLNLAEIRILPILKLKYSQFEQDPLNIKDFMVQNDTFCLSERYSSSVIRKQVVSISKIICSY